MRCLYHQSFTLQNFYGGKFAKIWHCQSLVLYSTGGVLMYVFKYLNIWSVENSIRSNKI